MPPPLAPLAGVVGGAPETASSSCLVCSPLVAAPEPRIPGALVGFASSGVRARILSVIAIAAAVTEAVVTLVVAVAATAWSAAEVAVHPSATGRGVHAPTRHQSTQR